MYKISDNYYINPSKIARMVIVSEINGKTRYFIVLTDGTRHQILSKEQFDDLATQSGTQTFSQLTVTDKLTVGDIEDVEGEINDIRQLIASDVKDIVANYEELLAYDTSTLTVGDIIEVLDDENYDHANTMYRFTNEGNPPYEFVGKLGTYYTKEESDDKYVKEVRLEVEESEEEGASVEGNLVYIKGNGTKEVITSLSELRNYLLTPAPDTPDVDNTEDKDSELTVIVTDSDGQAVKMTLEQLRKRFLASSNNDNVNFEDAQIGEFIYDEIIEEEIPADWTNMNGKDTWDAEYANPNSALRKYYVWSDDVNKPYKEDLWNTVENRAANITDARKIDGEYVYDENGNYIYDNCERCWLGAINAPGASYPWAVVELPIPFEGTIRFNYKDEEPVYPWGKANRTFTRGFAIASIPDELNKPELKINAEGESLVPLLDGDLIITLLPKLEEGE